MPRYVRVNTLKCSVGDALEHLISEGWRRVRLARNATYADFIERYSTYHSVVLNSFKAVTRVGRAIS